MATGGRKGRLPARGERASKPAKPAKSSPAAKPSKPSQPSIEEVLAKIVEPKKLPSVLSPRELPELVRIAGSAPLGLDEKERVLRAMVSGQLRFDPLASVLRDALTPESRDAFALALLRLWEEKEFHGRYEWVVDGVTVMGGDQAVIALARHMAEWPKQSDTGRKRAIGAVPMLAGAGTDTAALALLGLRQTAVVPSVVESIIEGIKLTVRQRKTTLSELFDVVTPTLGLDAHGRRTFELGDDDRLIAAFDDHFEPRLRDASGAVVDEVPDVVRGTWDALSAQLREAVKVQTFRLEQDMIGGRRWDAAAWSKCFREHPLLVSFTRRLVWGVYERGRLVAAFRTAEDQSLVGRDDREFHLPSGAQVGLVHPLELDAEARAAWGLHFSDYEIIQPFPQLGRALYEPSDAERAASPPATVTERFARARIKSGVLRDVLVRKGWERDPSYVRMFFERDFLRDGVVAIARLSPGVMAGSASYEIADQTITEIEFRQLTGGKKSRKSLPVVEVPPIAFSEAMLDIADVIAEQG